MATINVKAYDAEVFKASSFVPALNMDFTDQLRENCQNSRNVRKVFTEYLCNQLSKSVLEAHTAVLFPKHILC